MGEENKITLGPGTLYIKGEPVPYELGYTEELEPPPEWQDNPLLKIGEAMGTLTATLRIATDALIHLIGVAQEVLTACPNRRVVHLALYAKKHRTRKKNLHRAFKLLEKEARR